MDTVLVTGGAGFIGSHVCDALLADRQVVCLDNFNDYYDPERKRSNIKHLLEEDHFHLVEADIRDMDVLKKVFSEHKPDKIIHLAARAGVRASLEDPVIYEEVNVKGTLHLLMLALEHDIEHFVFGSSSSVYGAANKIPFSEEDSTDFPISPYAATKKAGEALCHTYSYLGLPVTCLRFFTVYGPRGRPDMAPFKFTDLISNDRPIFMFGDGTSKRDYTYVADIVQGVVASLDRPRKFDIINLGNNTPVQLKHFISTIENILGKKAKVIRKPMPPGDVPVTYADISKAQKMLGYTPETDIETGMQKFISWYQENI